jgi:hypothetical protein
MEENTVSERVAMLVQHYTKGNKSAFAKLVGISNQSLGEIVGARQSAPSFAALQKIFLAFPQIRMEWLILGRGPMLDLGSESLTLADTLEGVSPEEIRHAVRSSQQQWEKLEKVEIQVNAIQEWAKKLIDMDVPANIREALKLPDSVSKTKEE